MAEKVNLASFVKKLQRAMNKPAQRLSRTVEIGAFEEAVVLESVLEEALTSIDEQLPPLEQDRKLVYFGSPTIREAAGRLLELRAIDDPMDIFKAISRADMAAMAKIVGELTTKAMQPTVKELEEVKN